MQKCSKVNYNFSFSLSSVAATLLQVKVKLLLLLFYFCFISHAFDWQLQNVQCFFMPTQYEGFDVCFSYVGENGWLALLCKLNLI